MNEAALQAQVSEVAEETGVPGVAVGVLHGDEQHLAFHGVTSVEDPLPIDERTLYQIASTGKTHTATAIMRLMAQGRVDLDERVRAYVPELRLQDERVAEEVTVGTLLNHTAGWDGGDEVVDTGEGDDALGRYVDTFDSLPQNTPPGAVASYNNAAFALAGRVIEKVTGQTYERAVTELLVEPLGLDHTFLFPAKVMEHRFSASHVQDDAGQPRVFRPLAAPRVVAGMGGRTNSTVVDQLAWARFHMGDGAPLLPTELLHRMQQPSTDQEVFPGVGIGVAWWLRQVDGVRVLQHPGAGAGQKSAFTMVPERDFAVVVLVNCVPNGYRAHETITRWALEAYLGVVERDPEPLDLTPQELAPYVGTYRTGAIRMDAIVTDGGLEIQLEMIRGGGEPPALDSYRVGMVDGERFVVVDGPYQGRQGRFVREGDEAVSLQHGGRLAFRAGPGAGTPAGSRP